MKILFDTLTMFCKLALFIFALFTIGVCFISKNPFNQNEISSVRVI